MAKVYRAHKIKDDEAVPVSQVIVDGKRMLAGDKAPDGYEFYIINHPVEGYALQYLKRKDKDAG